MTAKDVDTREFEMRGVKGETNEEGKNLDEEEDEEGEEYGEDDLAEDDMSRDYMVMEPKMEEFVKEEAKEVKKVN